MNTGKCSRDQEGLTKEQWEALKGLSRRMACMVSALDGSGRTVSPEAEDSRSKTASVRQGQ